MPSYYSNRRSEKIYHTKSTEKTPYEVNAPNQRCIHATVDHSYFHISYNVCYAYNFWFNSYLVEGERQYWTMSNVLIGSTAAMVFKGRGTSQYYFASVAIKVLWMPGGKHKPAEVQRFRHRFATTLWSKTYCLIYKEDQRVSS